MATTTQTTSRDPGRASWLEDLLYGQERQVINPELKQILLRTGGIGADWTDQQALDYWNEKGADFTRLRGGDALTDLFGGTDPYKKQLESFLRGEKKATIGSASGGGAIDRDYGALRDMLAAFEGDSGALGRNSLIADARSANDDLSRMLAAMRESGGLPGAEDIAAGRKTASELYRGQQTRLNQRFEDMNTDYARRAASMGRDVMDPILQAKLAQEKTRQASVLDADEAATAQQYAMNLPGQRLSYQQMLTDLKGGLAAQAFANRAAILSQGIQLGQQERNWRLGTSGTTSTSREDRDLFEQVTGAIGALGTAASAGSKIAGMFGGGGGGGMNSALSSGMGGVNTSMNNFNAGTNAMVNNFGGRTRSTGPSLMGGGNWSNFGKPGFGGGY